jgi:hypothetical protein
MARDLLMVRTEETRPGAGATAVLASLTDELRGFGPTTDSAEFHVATLRVMHERLLRDAGKSSPRLSWAG